MFLNNFSVRIPQGIEQPGGYFELEHNTDYTLVLRNARPTRCDVRVEINGKHVGTWGIEPQGEIEIERPARDTGGFTFYKLDTREAAKVGLNKHNLNTGLIKITFTPEREVRSQLRVLASQLGAKSCSTPELHEQRAGILSTAPTRYSAGGTGLSGSSNQRFSWATDIVYDYTQQTVIHLQLVAGNQNEPRPLTAFKGSCYTPFPNQKGLKE